MKRGIILAGLLGCALAGVERLPGHGVLDRVVQHHIVATAGASHLDVTVELTFHSDFAQRECRRLDADGDGLIPAEETRRYPDEILGTLEAGLWISAGKREIYLTTLHPPEVDLLENEAAGAHPLRVRASYVARLDDRMRQAGPVELEDRLWPEAPALCSLQVRSQERTGGLVRKPLRFWNHDRVEQLIATRLDSLDEVERLVARARSIHGSEVSDEPRGEGERAAWWETRRLAEQGPELLDRVAEARRIYRQLRQRWKREGSQRQGIR